MLRRILVTLAVALAGLVVFGGGASAADDDYGPTGVVALNVAAGDETVESGEEFDLFGDGFTPGETIDVVGTFTTSGSCSANTTESPLSFVVTADSNGHFLIPGVSYCREGVINFVATGRSSGRVATQTVTIGPAGPTTTTTTTIVAAAGSGSTGSGGGSTQNSGSGLAYTGASVVGPIAVGLGALLAGLALLFFGTRGVIRHKNAKAHPSV